jgi:hypothetical protein
MSTPTAARNTSTTAPAAPVAPASDAAKAAAHAAIAANAATQTGPSAPPPAAPAAPALETDFISGGAFTLAADLADVTAPVRARNEKQMAMDKMVKNLHAKWLAIDPAKRPSTWDGLVKAGCVATYFVQPELAADLHKLISRAVTLHGVRSRIGTSFLVTDTVRANMLKRGINIPEAYLGREAISFSILDKRPRAAVTNRKEATKPATATGAQTK